MTHGEKEKEEEEGVLVPYSQPVICEVRVVVAGRTSAGAKEII